MTDVKMDKKRANQAAKIKKYIAGGAVYFFLALMAFIVLFPFWIALVTSFKLPAESLSLDFTWWPETFTLNGYIDVFTYVGGNTVQTPLIILGFINTMWMYLPRAVIATVLAGMAGFAYAKLRFRAKNAMFGFLMATMMLPGVITLVPSYLLFYYYDWLNTPLPVIMPGLLGGVSAVFFLKQYYVGVPSDMMDAASVDGLGFFGIYFRIMLPIAMPAFWAQFVLAFVTGYNEYLGPMLYLKSASLLTLQLALQQFASSRQYSDPGAVMAGTLIAIVPTVALFVFAQRYFISGIVTSGLKL